MKKNNLIFVFAGLCMLPFGSCQQGKQNSTVQDHAEALRHPADTSLIAVLRADQNARVKDSISILFKVVNRTSDTLQYTRYHTPFEGIISNFLTVTDTQGNEVRYKGPMAKRIMPPPADTYRRLAPGAEDSIRFDLKKAYHIDSAGTYILQYNSELVSGIANGQPIQITVKK